MEFTQAVFPSERPPRSAQRLMISYSGLLRAVQFHLGGHKNYGVDIVGTGDFGRFHLNHTLFLC